MPLRPQQLFTQLAKRAHYCHRTFLPSSPSASTTASTTTTTQLPHHQHQHLQQHHQTHRTMASSTTSTSTSTSPSRPAPSSSTPPNPGLSPSQSSTPPAPASSSAAAAAPAAVRSAHVEDLPPAKDTTTGTTGTATQNHHHHPPSADVAIPKPLPALPAPGTETAEDPSQKTTTVVVNGAPISLDALGPMVVNRDGTLARIANWQEMSSFERENTLRVLGKRNQLRLATLRGEESPEKKE
ncbi:hypothetical protein QBC41DRAFT_350310 [Cercophora samala]|uniref:Uncharacterized protein n=1 Tax=Cercophora samala TaxID=330535 RepID=A0AA39Z3V4_9PEZI|nr:hypothetical protein QBC41DRAFT_350310 [Cercophora samala]